ncbi:apoptosis-inducing factor 1, mitochondrial [Polistes fuscatus]|uniref:apoptosis-inducing factor 1, mitochondrial n=1 Tax=Polistes fuscatus TaxID=30207 RepID=UPI001CA99980|nr:apoptosis-inducing factor 1, mitochondrial [Polistes fuscatus]XP_043502939.1 apoptosis-inducing factor 1, mitochondrial [Polistes fuscatus]XP_043502940.1 apoptosis-inducing factor 1, mitochondrial [Polistes fuscatus]
MLSCGRIIGQLSKVTRHAHTNHSYRTLKYVGIFSVNRLCYSNNANNKKPYRTPGTTIKPEECLPESKYSKPKKPLPACEAQRDGTCPPSCKPDYTQEDGNGKNGKFPYWKHLLATLIIAGVTIYAISSTEWFTDKFDSQSDTKKKKDTEKRYRRSKDVIKTPAVSKSIPQEVPYLLIGGGTAAFSAFRSIKSRDPKAKVLIISEEEDLPYMRPPLSKELWYNTDRATSAKLNFKQWNGTQRSLFYEPREFYTNVDKLMQLDKGGVAVAVGWKVTKIDATNKIAVLEDGHEIKYDKCLIATGASPKNLPLFESAPDEVKDKIIAYRTKQDFLELEDNIHNPNCKNVVIIGGGFLGSELACSLARNYQDKKIIQVYKENYIMAQVLPEYLSEWTTKKAMAEGVICTPNVEVSDFSYKNKKLDLILSDGNTIEADQVIVAIGVEPNADLATSSQLEVHPNVGGFLVNAELEARSNLWVAGDAACFYDVRLGRRRVEHHDHAVISGRLAGENMTGAGKPYLHQSMFWSDLGPEVGYEAIGIVDSSFPTVGVFAKATEADTPKAALTELADEEKAIAQTEAIKKEETRLQNDKQSPISGNENKNVTNVTDKKEPKKRSDFEKGVVFYLRDDIVVGIVLWNIFHRMSIARQVLARGTKYDDLNEVAKLFSIHDD